MKATPKKSEFSGFCASRIPFEITIMIAVAQMAEKSATAMRSDGFTNLIPGI
jgi:hypothetical protein